MSDWLLGVDEVKDASGEVEREATPGLETTEKGADLKKGHKRFEKLFANRDMWEDMDPRKAYYKEKRGIDRRFSGPKHRRTRECSSSDDSDSDDELDADSGSSF
ncbi:unnamed protein product [Laminaria digitata]